MPRGDKTGPTGNGPMTGRQKGDCASKNHPGRVSENPGLGRGQGRRVNANKGIGRRFRNRGYGSFSEVDTENDSISFLMEEIQNLKKQLSGLNKSLSDSDQK